MNNQKYPANLPQSLPTLPSQPIQPLSNPSNNNTMQYIIVFVLIFIFLLITGWLFFDRYVKDLRFDEIRFADFSNLEEPIQKFFVESGRLPQKLDELPPYVNINDSKTTELYFYEPLSYSSFTFCVTYSQDTETPGWKRYVNQKLLKYEIIASLQPHPAGRQCKQISIDSQVVHNVRIEQGILLRQNKSQLFTVLVPKEGELIERFSPYDVKWEFYGTSATDYSRTQISLENYGITILSKDVQSKPNTINSFTWIPDDKTANALADNSYRIMISLYDDYPSSQWKCTN